MPVDPELLPVIAFASELSSFVNNISGIAANVNSLFQGQTAFQAQVFAQLGFIENQQLAILAQERQLWADLGRQIQGLGAQTGIPQQATQPVILPAVPPPAYSAPPATDVADSVWNWQDIPTSYHAFELLRWSGQAAGLIGRFTWLWVPNGSFLQYQSQVGAQIAVNPGSTPYIEPSTILPTDLTAADWVARAYVGPPWDGGDVAGGFPGYVGVNSIAYQVPMSQPLFLWYRFIQSGGLVKPGQVPPVWPGAAGVTSGSAVAIVPSAQTITGPMHGVRIHLATIPTPLPFYQYGSMTAYGKLGGLTFLSDDGDAETQELLGFVDQVFVPKNMVKAASCEIRVKSGTTGTVTPWTLA